MVIETLQYGEHTDLTYAIIGAAIDVHKALGPGLLESAYESCLAYELSEKRIKFHRQLPLPLEYKGKVIESGYRLDFLIEDTVILELKAIEKILPIHEAQLITYLKLSGKKIGYILNFNELALKDGIRKISM